MIDLKAQLQKGLNDIKKIASPQQQVEINKYFQNLNKAIQKQDLSKIEALSQGIQKKLNEGSRS